MIKFAKSKYSSYNDRFLKLSVKMGDVFAVTPEIENSKVFQDGVATKNFVFVEVTNVRQLREVVNLTDAIYAEFVGKSVAPAPVPVPEPIPIVEEPNVVPVAEVTIIMPETVSEEIPEELPPEEPVEEELPEETVDVDSMTRRELQKYALELEEKFGIQIDRNQKKVDLLSEIKAIIEEHE